MTPDASGGKGSERTRRLVDARRELAGLEADWRESLSHYTLRLDAQFKELSRRLESPGRAKKGTPSAREAESVYDALAHARVKPGKGRAKDLRRVEAALAKALDSLPELE